MIGSLSGGLKKYYLLKPGKGELIKPDLLDLQWTSNEAAQTIDDIASSGRDCDEGKDGESEDKRSLKRTGESSEKSPWKFFFDVRFNVISQNGGINRVNERLGVLDVDRTINELAKNYHTRNLSEEEKNNYVLTQKDKEKFLRKKGGRFQNKFWRAHFKEWLGDHMPANMLDDAIESAIIVKDLSYLKSEKKILNVLKQRTKGMSFRQKLTVLATFLGAFNNNYDNKRLGGGPTSKGAVSFMTLMKTMNSNLTKGTIGKAGVCRDMHHAGIKLANAMGIPNAFSAAFSTAGGAHANNIVKGNIIVNYGSVTETDKNGVLALAQNTSLPDTGTTFRIYGPKGYSMTLLSEKGRMLSHATGNTGAMDLFDTTFQFSGALIGGKKGNHESRVFYLQSPDSGTGEKIVGTSYSYGGTMASGNVLGVPTKLDGKVISAVYYGKRDVMIGSLDTTGVYLNAQTSMENTLFKSDRFRLTARNEFNLMAQGGYGKLSYADSEKSKSGFSGDFHIFMNSQIKADYNTSKTEHSTKLEAKIEMGHKTDVRDSLSGPTVRIPTTKLSHQSKVHLTSGITSSIMLAVGARDLGVDYLHTQYRGGAGLDFHSTGTKIEYHSEGGLGSIATVSNPNKNYSEAPAFLPGMQHRGRLDIQQKLYEKRGAGQIHLYLQGEKAYQTSEHGLNIGLKGEF